MRVSTRLYHSEAQLAELGAPESAFERACALDDLGRPADAAAAYAALLDREPSHFGGLTNLGMLLLERGAPEAARPYLTRAAAVLPGDPGAQTNLGRLEHAGEQLVRATRALLLDRTRRA